MLDTGFSSRKISVPTGTLNCRVGVMSLSWTTSVVVCACSMEKVRVSFR